MNQFEIAKDIGKSLQNIPAYSTVSHTEQTNVVQIQDTFGNNFYVTVEPA